MVGYLSTYIYDSDETWFYMSHGKNTTNKIGDKLSTKIIELTVICYIHKEAQIIFILRGLKNIKNRQPQERFLGTVCSNIGRPIMYIIRTALGSYEIYNIWSISRTYRKPVELPLTNSVSTLSSSSRFVINFVSINNFFSAIKSMHSWVYSIYY